MEKYFKIYISIYGKSSNFNSGGGKALYLLLMLFYKIVTLFKTFYFLIINYILKSAPIIEVIFTKNQLTASKKLGLEQSTKIFIGTTKERLNNTHLLISDRTLFLESLIAADKVYQTLKKHKRYSFYWNNVNRLIKLKALKCYLNNSMIEPKTVINFNDHTPYNVFIYDYFKQMKSKLIYCQHATVSDKFPPLYHDLNLLYSEQSINSYMKAGSIKTSNILLIGDLRLWGWEQCKNSKISDKNVLICSNKLDDNNDVIRIAKKLHRQGFVVKIRKHPSDKSYSFSKKQYVFSKNKSLRQDICDSDIIITNESAIPVEALFLNKAIYVYNFKSKENAWETYDNYHFIKYGLIEKKISSDEELVLLIKTGKKLWNREKLNYFVGPIEKKIKTKQKLLKYIES